jgi:hypothetical protein
MIGARIKCSGDQQRIKQYCANKGIYTLENANFDEYGFYHLVECLSGESHTAKCKAKSSVSVNPGRVRIYDTSILSKVNIDHPYLDMYIIMVATS